MPDLILAVALIICLITDLQERKIYNKVLFPTLVLGVAYNLYAGGWLGLQQSILGLLTGLGILLIPFALGGMGAGDVKLLAVIGALKGPLFVFYTAIFMALAGGILALAVLVYQGKLWSLLKILARGTWLFLISRGKVRVFEFDQQISFIPYGLAITAGAIGAYWWMG
jgi:prepilin peptidase CpaA